MINVDKALEEIKELLGRGLYPTALPKIRDILEQLARRQSKKRITGIAVSTLMCGILIGGTLVGDFPAFFKYCVIALYAVFVVALLIYAWTGAE